MAISFRYPSLTIFTLGNVRGRSIDWHKIRDTSTFGGQVQIITFQFAYTYARDSRIKALNFSDLGVKSQSNGFSWL